MSNKLAYYVLGALALILLILASYLASHRGGTALSPSQQMQARYQAMTPSQRTLAIRQVGSTARLQARTRTAARLQARRRVRSARRPQPVVRTAPAPSQQARARFRARIQAKYSRQQGNSAPRQQPNVVNNSPFWRGDACILLPANQLGTWESASEFVDQLREEIRAVYHAQYPVLKNNAFRTTDLSCFEGSKIGLPKWTRATQDLWADRLTNSNCNYRVRGGAVNEEVRKQGLFPMLHGAKKDGSEFILKDTQFKYGLGAFYGVGIYGQFLNDQVGDALLRVAKTLKQWAVDSDTRLRVITAVSLPTSVKLINNLSANDLSHLSWVREVNANGAAEGDQIRPERKYCDASFPLMLWETTQNCLNGANSLQDFPWHQCGMFPTRSFPDLEKQTREEIEGDPRYQSRQESLSRFF